MITPLTHFSGNNIDDLHKRAIRVIFEHGRDINFGDEKEQKLAREIDGTMQVHGHGLRKVLKGKTPRGFLWSGEKVKVLQEQFVDSRLNPYNFDYTYPEQLRAYSKGLPERYDQLGQMFEGLRKDIRSGVLSNRRVGVLYHPTLHNEREMPCFNWFQVRYQGDRKVSLRLLFRSHDWGTALWANLSSVAYCFDELVFKELGLELEEIICHSASAHVYNNDAPAIEAALNVKWWQSLSAGWWKK